MSRRAAEPLVVGLACLFALLVACVAPVPLQAQTDSERPGIALTLPVHEALVLLQDLWTEWHQGFRDADADRTAESMADLLATIRQLGVNGVVDLSAAASALAVEAARQGDYERAGWALEAAEFLDPERPETLFARARVEWLRGSRLRAPLTHLEGFLRLFRHSWEQRVWRYNMALWGAYLAAVVSVLFVGVQATVKGPSIYRSILAPLGERLPAWLAHLLTVVVLLWPLALPQGILWFFVYASALVWTRSLRSERAVLCVIWFLLGAIPSIVDEQRRRVAITQSPPVRAMHQLRDGRISGAMLTELGGLRRQLPDSIAVRQLLADVHRRLGQPDFARTLYLEVLDAEPQNASALVDLGAYYLHSGDPQRAAQYFQTATAVAPDDVAGYFNLSLAYSASFRFDEADDVLRQAKQIDDARVNRWMSRSVAEWVVTFDGGIGRIREIERQLIGPVWEGHAGNFVVSVLALVTALGLGFVVGRSTEVRDSSRLTDLAAMPGVQPAREGKGLSLVLELLPVAFLVLLPLAPRIGYPILWGFEPAQVGLFLLSGVVATGYFLLRIGPRTSA